MSRITRVAPPPLRRTASADTIALYWTLERSRLIQMLKRLHLDNFRCLTNFEIKPAPVSVLVGPNGVGKSALFDALLALQELATAGTTVDQSFHPLSRTRWDTRNVQRLELDAQEPGGPFFQYLLNISHEPARRRVFIERERLTADGNLLYEQAGGEVRLFGDEVSPTPRISFPFDSRRSFLPVLEPRADNQLITAFKRWLAGMTLFALRPAEFEWSSMSETEGVHFTGRNFVSWYRSVVQESPDVAERVRTSVQPAIPGLTNLRLTRMGLDSRMLSLECEVAGSRFTLYINELSDGQRCLLFLYTVLHALTREATLLIFDEPDNFVAEQEIQPWLSQVRDAMSQANRGTLMVISHHPEVIDYLAADQALSLSRPGGGPTRVSEVHFDREKGMSASQWIKMECADGQ